MADTLPLINLNGEASQRLTQFLDTEYKRATSAHTSRLAEDRLDDKFYDAKSEPKNWPWQNASNIRVPLGRIMVDSVKARVQSAIEDHAPKIWTVKTGRPEEQAQIIAEGAESYMEAVAMRQTEMNMGSVNESVISHLCRLGYAPIKIPYVKDVVADRYYDRDMKLQERALTKYEGVRPELVPGSHFLMPPEARNPQDARWISYKLDMSFGTMKQRQSEKRWYAKTIGRVKGSPIDGSPSTDIEKERSARDGVKDDDTPSLDSFLWRFWEFHLRWDPHNDGRLFDIIVLYHPETMTIARAVYNWYAHRERPLVMPTYSLREDDPWSGGIMRRLRPLNVAIDTMLNQSIDNATVANTRIWKYQMNEPALKNGLDIWPSAGIALKDVNNLKGEQLGEIYPSSYNLLNIVQQWAERDVGLFDTNLGNTGALKSDVAATSVMATMQEGSTRLNTSIKELRRQYAMMGMQSFMNYQQFNPVAKGLMYLSPEQFESVRALFELPIETIRSSLFVELRATTAAMSRQVQKQDALTLWQMVVQYYAGVVNLGMQAMQMMSGSPGLAQGMFKMIDQAGIAFRQVLVNFEVPDPDSFIVKSETLLGAREGGADELGEIPGIGGVASVAAGGAGSAGPTRLSSPVSGEGDGGSNDLDGGDVVA